MGASFLLHARHDITLYEKSNDIGGHSRTRVVQHGDKAIPVDTGFIVFNYPNYPHLTAMFKHLGVKTEKSDMTFAITINNGAMEWGAKNPNAVFGQRRNLFKPEFWGFIRDIFRFNGGALKIAEANPELTLGQLLDGLKAGDWYRRYFILPIGGAIWSCSLSEMLSFPAITFVQFFKAHGLLSVVGQPQWHTVTGGSREYIKLLTAPYRARIRAGCAAARITRSGDKVQVTDTLGNTDEYDELVLACH
ncbi:MAG: FAD-dependent oxidoreductase, partial [Rickettsiales bacterium]|nr:FAD-dependent oxidoreductase [Rickettsiales bacterium]